MPGDLSLKSDPTEEIDLGMTNFDHSIDDGLAEALQAGSVYGIHSAWDFNGRVWWNGAEFVEQVWRYHAVVDLLTAPTLEELMETVNDKWGGS